MALTLGFATEFYTLWDIIVEPVYRTDAYGKHWHVSDMVKYNYIKNVSIDLAKAQQLHPGVPFDEDLRGISRSWHSERTLPDPCPHILSFGKYSGHDIAELIISDFKYSLWLLENANSNILRQLIAQLPQMIAYKAKVNNDHQTALKDVKRLEGSGIVTLTILCNPIDMPVYLSDDNGDDDPEIENVCMVMKATLGDGSDIRLIVEETKYMPGSYSYPGYYLPVFDGQARRIKHKVVTFDLKLLYTRVSTYPQKPGIYQVCNIKALVPEAKAKKIKVKQNTGAS